MASIINKRQQARNERVLQDLIKNVPGNERCADCFTRNPGWASWSLGVFLCVRCAALHRKLGTHISKVKSLSMDSWSSDQVENMKRVGNVASNRIYNPRNIKPVIPVDEDEIDPAVERYIRQKYQHKTLGTDRAQPALTHRTGSSTSTDDIPPPPPPKPTTHFGASVRANSSQYPGTQSESPLPALPDQAQESRRLSKVPDTSLGNRRRSFDLKLERLKELGFTNASRNNTVLKGLNGNFEKSIQTLIRLGEGDPVIKSTNMPNALPNALPSSISEVQRAPTPQQPQAPQAADSMQATQQQSGASTIGVTVANQQTNEVPTSYNPFLAPQQNHQVQQTPMDQAFSNMQISPQPLFPNNTGNWRQLQEQQTNPFLKNLTPPISPTTYQQAPPFGQPVVNQTDNGARANPFLRTSRSQNFATSSNPFYQSPQSTGSASFDQQALNVPPVPSLPQWANNGKSASLPLVGLQQQPQQFQTFGQPFAPQQQQQLYESPSQSPTTWEQQHQNNFFGNADRGLQHPQQNMFSNPFHQQQQQQAQLQPQQQNHAFYQNQPQFQQPHQILQQQNQTRYDKNSLLALYNYPHLAPPKPAVSSPLASESSSPSTNAPQQQQTWQATQPKRVSTMPLMASQSATAGSTNGRLNPFAQKQGAQYSPSPGHISQESVDFTTLMNGRHSPDAFTGLSARAL